MWSKDTWCVSPVLGDSGGSLKCPATGSSTLPPEMGWSYYTGQSDPILSCLPLSSSSSCAIVTITAKGEAKLQHPSCLGTYISKGEYSSGRQVVSSLSTPGPAVTSVPGLPQAGRREGEAAPSEARADCLGHQ